jgi:hypothetical protein
MTWHVRLTLKFANGMAFSRDVMRIGVPGKSHVQGKP